jgi:hypothetical protein
LVIVGAPHVVSRTTLRPFGPNVTYDHGTCTAGPTGVDKELPALIDTADNAGLLQTLGINVDALATGARPDHVAVESR